MNERAQPVRFGRRCRRAALLLVACVETGCLRADVTLGAPFRDHAVLQRAKPILVWGEADPHERVTVEFKHQTRSTKSDAEGRWRVSLEPMAASAEPAQLVATGKNAVTVKDVLVGEVWLCSGQSNMNFNVRQARDAAREMAEAHHPLIRHLLIKSAVSEYPMNIADGEWAVCSPARAGEFTAVGYFFARELQRDLGVPIGIVKATLGGSPIEAWISGEALTGDPAFAVVAERWNRISADFIRRTIEHQRQLADWLVRRDATMASGGGFSEPRPSRVPARGDRNMPGGLYNGFIHPLRHMALAGFLWYQGEGNAERASEYNRLFSTMIRQWRREFQQDDLPFVFAQLPNYAPPKDPDGEEWAWLRSAQASVAAELPRVSMAVTIDLGDPTELHPTNKQAVGHRLAMMALRDVHGRDVAASGPVYTKAQREGSSLRLHFTHAAGLRFGGDATRLFEVAGVDRMFVPAKATIEGETVVVSAAGVDRPVAVRYNWKNSPGGSLFNDAALPAAPFRTDPW